MTTPLDAALDRAGLTLIEASAGSGKTRAITTLVARLVVERELGLDRFLVVTFTRAATAELKERLRRFLRALVQAMDGADDGDGQVRELLDRWRRGGVVDLEDARRRLGLAMQDIDRANVHTIHGTCARLLSEFSFECGLPFALEVGGAQAETVTLATHDFWRSRMGGFSPGLAHHLRETRVTPESLTRWAAAVPQRPGLEVRGVCGTADAHEEHEGGWRDALARVRHLWGDHGGAFRQFTVHGPLNRSRYRVASVEKDLGDLERRLADPEGPLWPERLVSRFGASRLADSLRKGASLPDNPLFEAFDRLEAAARELRGAYDNAVRRLRKDLLDAVATTRRRLVREKRQLGYHDLLGELDAALRGPSGAGLARSLRETYPVALIDEYQDTDPLQASIFRRIYGAPPKASGSRATLFVVGDPKQSIYGFRGADVFSYIEAKRRARGTLALDRNWRSTPALVGAVNRLFAGAEPFLLDSIAFHPAMPGREAAPDLETGDDGPPLRLWRLAGATGADAGAEAARATANDIRGLLARAVLGGRPLKGSDVAVLVRTRFQGRLAATELRRRGVGCVEFDDTSIFETREAAQMERLLWALAQPGREDRERTALTGDLFGLDNRELADLGGDGGAWEQWADRFGAWRRMWRSRGIGATLRRIADASGPSKGLAAYANAARRLSNVRHLTELLQEAESELRLGPAGLATWFGRQKRGIRGDGATELRLESDENLVRIMTIHGCKGLEFPVVYCPFTWYCPGRRSSASDWAAFHIEKDGAYPLALTLDPGPGDLTAEAVEAFMEELRLLYVALTRARERCVIVTAPPKVSVPKSSAAMAPLAWLIHRTAGDGPADPGDDEAAEQDRAVTGAMTARLSAVRDRIGSLDEAAWKEELERFAASSQGTIRIDRHDPASSTHTPPGSGAQDTLAARTFGRELRNVRQITSFSALSSGHGRRDGAEREAVGRPDHDEEASEAAPGDGEVSADPATPFAFPRGTTSGRCLHSILEALDTRSADDLDSVCGRYLRHYGIDLRWKDAARAMVTNTRSTLLGEPGHDGFRLEEALPRLPELEFHLPAEDLRTEAISGCLKRHGYADPIPSSRAGGPIEGYLRGFIDLVVAVGGRWYVLDYKSNWLGNRPDDYAPDKLDPAMHRSGYTFQYLLYLVALDRYLATRLGDYAYDRHVGGAFYLFLRGIDAGAGMARGVYFDRPDEACIRDLDACFRR